MLTRIEAQGLTDALAAVALGAYVLGAARRGVQGPLERRLAFAFGGLCLFFIFRAAAEMLSSPTLTLIAEIVACALPLAGLVLAEGMLRRHAPRVLKFAITLGAVTVGIGLIAVSGRAPFSNWGLGGYVTLSILALTMLLLFRDTASLSRQENASIGALMLAGAGLMLLSLTDFFRETPVGMSGIGASLLAFIAAANPNSAREGRRALSDVIFIAVGAGLFASGLAPALGLTAPEITRLGVITFALVIAIAAVLALRERMAEDDTRSLRQALASADTSSLLAFLESVAGQPLLEGLTLAEAETIADYDHRALTQTLSARPVWTRQALRQAEQLASDRGREELTDLMARTDATHAALLSHLPLRIALLTLPEIGPADDAAIDLALFSKLAALASEQRA